MRPVGRGFVVVLQRLRGLAIAASNITVELQVRCFLKAHAVPSAPVLPSCLLDTDQQLLPVVSITLKQTTPILVHQMFYQVLQTCLIMHQSFSMRITSQC